MRRHAYEMNALYEYIHYIPKDILLLTFKYIQEFSNNKRVHVADSCKHIEKKTFC